MTMGKGDVTGDTRSAVQIVCELRGHQRPMLAVESCPTVWTRWD